jgi:predicted TIM-barrel fold metal-dependent hydrolase
VLEGMQGASVTEVSAVIRDDKDSVWAQMFGSQGAYDPADRVRFLDSRGIDRQFVLPTVGQVPYTLAKQTGNDELAQSCLAAYNSWSIERLAGFSDRLIPVGLIDLTDLGSAMAEVTRLREGGCRVVQIRSDPVHGKSLAHPDVEPLWSLLDDLGVATMFHLGSSRPAFDRGWANVGERSVNGWTGMMLTLSQWPSVVEVALAGLIYGGVMERHPGVFFFVAEYGISWVPSWVERLESWIGHQPMYADDYRLPLRPTSTSSARCASQPFATTRSCRPWILLPQMLWCSPATIPIPKDRPTQSPTASASSSAWTTPGGSGSLAGRSPTPWRCRAPLSRRTPRRSPGPGRRFSVGVLAAHSPASEVVEGSCDVGNRLFAAARPARRPARTAGERRRQPPRPAYRWACARSDDDG